MKHLIMIAAVFAVFFIVSNLHFSLWQAVIFGLCSGRLARHFSDSMEKRHAQKKYIEDDENSK